MSDAHGWTALIVDDERLARDGLRAALGEFPRVRVVGEAADGDAALEQVARLSPDVVFLDIQMPGRQGLDVARELAGGNGPLVVFVTAWDEHAVEAFELRALDYLVKPWDDARLRSVVEHVEDRLGEGRHWDDAERIQALLATLDPGSTSAGPPASRLLVRDGAAYRFVDVDTIDLVEADGNHAILVRGAERHRIRASLRWLEEILDRRQFVRVHRSTIVNLDGVAEILPLESGDYEAVLLGGRRVRVSRHYRDRVLRRSI